jgi:hypothetical protein
MRRVSLLVVLLAAVATPVAGQVVPSPYRFLEKAQGISLQGGYVATQRGELDAAPHSAPVVQLEYLGRFAGPLSGTVAVTYMPTQRTVYDFDASNTLTPLGDVDARLLEAMAGLEFTLTGPRTWHSLAPFVGARGGLVIDLAGVSKLEKDAELTDEQRIDFGPSFAVGATAGADWFLTERLSIRAAGRGHLWRFTTPAGLAGKERNEWLKNGGGTLGVAFHF